MKVEVLIATMNQNDFSLYEKMNLNTDAIIANQADSFSYEEREINGNKVKLITTADRGVGKNRNIALLHSSGDILLFADDDVEYFEGYEQKIIDAYKKYPKADVIIFNFYLLKNGEKSIRFKGNGKVPRNEIYRYGTCYISIKRDFWIKTNIYFSLLFGGGAKYSCGEDILFMHDMHKAGAKIYKTDTIIGTINCEKSSWFTGYNDKYFFDKGVLFSMITPCFSRVTLLYHIIKHRKEYKEYGLLKAYKMMVKGATEGA
ncbi:MAG: glycosyltransferase family 2 protein [Treponema sp.]|nr:glycosyltransferase family 2 protein [Treponema sp.]